MSLLRNTFFTSIGQSSQVVFTFVASIVLARWLGPTDRGIYAILVTTLSLLALLGNLGLQPAFLYLVGKGRYPKAEIAGHAILFTAVAGGGLTVLVWSLPDRWIAAVLAGVDPTLIWLAVALALSPILNGFTQGILIGLDRIQLMVGVQLFLQITNAMLIVLLLIVLNLGLIGALVQLVVSSLLSLVLSIYVLHRYVGIRMRPKKALAVDALGFGLRSQPGFIGYSVLNRIDLYFVNYFAGSSSAGIYAVAVGLAEKLWVVDQAVSQAAMPQIASLERRESVRVTRRAFRSAFWSIAALAVLAAVISPWAIPFVYGEAYSGSVFAFVLLLPGVVALSTRIISPFFSLQMGRPGIPTLYGLGIGFLSVPIYLVAVKTYGYWGAAAGTSVVYLLLGVITLVLFLWYGETSIRATMIPTKDDMAILPRLIVERWRRLRLRVQSP